MNMDEQIQKAAELIRAGKLVAFPTETVYGLGANALDAKAVARIFEVKERPSFDPLIVHISDLDMLHAVAYADDERIKKLCDAFWPGPLTLILPKKKLVPDIVTSGLPTVGVRMPGNKTALKLIQMSACPIAAPSANKFGRTSPTQSWHVSHKLKGVDMVLDGGEADIGIESTIIRLLPDGFQILRPGAITEDDLGQIIPASVSNPEFNIMAPGMVQSHYSPDKAFIIVDSLDDIPADKRATAAVIPFTSESTDGFKKVVLLSRNGDMKTYATKIFAALHELESDEVDAIYAERLPLRGIGIAIMDRLEKAAFRHTHDPDN